MVATMSWWSNPADYFFKWKEMIPDNTVELVGLVLITSCFVSSVIVLFSQDEPLCFTQKRRKKAMMLVNQSANKNEDNAAINKGSDAYQHKTTTTDKNMCRNSSLDLFSGIGKTGVQKHLDVSEKSTSTVKGLGRTSLSQVKQVGGCTPFQRKETTTEKLQCMHTPKRETFTQLSQDSFRTSPLFNVDELDRFASFKRSKTTAHKSKTMGTLKGETHLQFSNGQDSLRTSPSFHVDKLDRSSGFKRSETTVEKSRLMYTPQRDLHTLITTSQNSLRRSSPFQVNQLNRFAPFKKSETITQKSRPVLTPKRETHVDVNNIRYFSGTSPQFHVDHKYRFAPLKKTETTTRKSRPKRTPQREIRNSSTHMGALSRSLSPTPTRIDYVDGYPPFKRKETATEKSCHLRSPKYSTGDNDGHLRNTIHDDTPDKRHHNYHSSPRDVDLKIKPNNAQYPSILHKSINKYAKKHSPEPNLNGTKVMSYEYVTRDNSHQFDTREEPLTFNHPHVHDEQLSGYTRAGANAYEAVNYMSDLRPCRQKHNCSPLYSTSPIESSVHYPLPYKSASPVDTSLDLSRNQSPEYVSVYNKALAKTLQKKWRPDSLFEQTDVHKKLKDNCQSHFKKKRDRESDSHHFPKNSYRSILKRSSSYDNCHSSIKSRGSGALREYTPYSSDATSNASGSEDSRSYDMFTRNPHTPLFPTRAKKLQGGGFLKEAHSHGNEKVFSKRPAQLFYSRSYDASTWNPVTSLFPTRPKQLQRGGFLEEALSHETPKSKHGSLTTTVRQKATPGIASSNYFAPSNRPVANENPTVFNAKVLHNLPDKIEMLNTAQNKDVNKPLSTDQDIRFEYPQSQPTAHEDTSNQLHNLNIWDYDTEKGFQTRCKLQGLNAGVCYKQTHFNEPEVLKSGSTLPNALAELDSKRVLFRNKVKDFKTRHSRFYRCMDIQKGESGVENSNPTRAINLPEQEQSYQNTKSKLPQGLPLSPRRTKTSNADLKKKSWARHPRECTVRGQSYTVKKVESVDKTTETTPETHEASTTTVPNPCKSVSTSMVVNSEEIGTQIDERDLTVEPKPPMIRNDMETQTNAPKLEVNLASEPNDNETKQSVCSFSSEASTDHAHSGTMSLLLRKEEKSSTKPKILDKWEHRNGTGDGFKVGDDFHVCYCSNEPLPYNQDTIKKHYYPDECYRNFDTDSQTTDAEKSFVLENENLELLRQKRRCLRDSISHINKDASSPVKNREQNPWNSNNKRILSVRDPWYIKDRFDNKEVLLHDISKSTSDCLQPYMDQVMGDKTKKRHHINSLSAAQTLAALDYMPSTSGLWSEPKKSRKRQTRATFLQANGKRLYKEHQHGRYTMQKHWSSKNENARKDFATPALPQDRKLKKRTGVDNQLRNSLMPLQRTVPANDWDGYPNFGSSVAITLDQASKQRNNLCENPKYEKLRNMKRKAESMQETDKRQENTAFDHLKDDRLKHTIRSIVSAFSNPDEDTSAFDNEASQPYRTQNTKRNDMSNRNERNRSHNRHQNTSKDDVTTTATSPALETDRTISLQGLQNDERLDSPNTEASRFQESLDNSYKSIDNRVFRYYTGKAYSAKDRSCNTRTSFANAANNLRKPMRTRPISVVLEEKSLFTHTNKDAPVLRVPCIDNTPVSSKVWKSERCRNQHPQIDTFLEQDTFFHQPVSKRLKKKPIQNAALNIAACSMELKQLIQETQGETSRNFPNMRGCDGAFETRHEDRLRVNIVQQNGPNRNSSKSKIRLIQTESETDEIHGMTKRSYNDERREYKNALVRLFTDSSPNETSSFQTRETSTLDDRGLAYPFSLNIKPRRTVAKGHRCIFTNYQSKIKHTSSHQKSRNYFSQDRREEAVVKKKTRTEIDHNSDTLFDTRVPISRHVADLQKVRPTNTVSNFNTLEEAQARMPNRKLTLLPGANGTLYVAQVVSNGTSSEEITEMNKTMTLSSSLNSLPTKQAGNLERNDYKGDASRFWKKLAVVTPIQRSSDSSQSHMTEDITGRTNFDNFGYPSIREPHSIISQSAASASHQSPDTDSRGTSNFIRSNSTSTRDMLHTFESDIVRYAPQMIDSTRSTQKPHQTTRSHQKQNRATRSTQKQNRATRSTQNQNHATRSTQKQNRATRSTQKQNRATRSTQKQNRTICSTKKHVRTSSEEGQLLSPRLSPCFENSRSRVTEPDSMTDNTERMYITWSEILDPDRHLESMREDISLVQGLQSCSLRSSLNSPPGDFSGSSETQAAVRKSSSFTRQANQHKKHKKVEETQVLNIESKNTSPSARTHIQPIRSHSYTITFGNNRLPQSATSSSSELTCLPGKRSEAKGLEKTCNVGQSSTNYESCDAHISLEETVTLIPRAQTSELSYEETSKKSITFKESVSMHHSKGRGESGSKTSFFTTKSANGKEVKISPAIISNSRESRISPVISPNGTDSGFSPIISPTTYTVTNAQQHLDFNENTFSMFLRRKTDGIEVSISLLPRQSLYGEKRHEEVAAVHKNVPKPAICDASLKECDVASLNKKHVLDKDEDKKKDFGNVSSPSNKHTQHSALKLSSSKKRHFKFPIRMRTVKNKKPAISTKSITLFYR